jgi:hypothetical protein
VPCLPHEAVHVKVFFMSIKTARDMAPNIDLRPQLQPITYEQAMLIPPGEGLQRSGLVRPFAIEPLAGEPHILGLTEGDVTVWQPVARLPGILDVIGGDSIIFAYLNREKEEMHRIGQPLGVWRGVHEDNARQDPAWYLIVKDMARQNPSTRVITPLAEPAVTYVSLDCFPNGPNGDASDPAFRKMHHLPSLESRFNLAFMQQFVRLITRR